MHKGKNAVAVVVLMMLIMMGYMVVLFFQQQKLLNANAAKAEAIKVKIYDQTVLRDRLLNEKDNLLSNENIERIAREVFGMVKPGEKVFIDADR